MGISLSGASKTSVRDVTPGAPDRGVSNGEAPSDADIGQASGPEDGRNSSGGNVGQAEGVPSKMFSMGDSGCGRVSSSSLVVAICVFSLPSSSSSTAAAGALLGLPQVQGIIFSMQREQVGVRRSQRLFACTQPLQFFCLDLGVAMVTFGMPSSMLLIHAERVWKTPNSRRDMWNADGLNQ